MPETGGHAVAVILARGGSKGIPRKNMRPVGGVSLIGRSVLAAKAARGVGLVLVSTDDDEIASESLRFGAEIVQRPADISGDRASSESGWIHALELRAGDIAKRGITRAIFLQCTSPFTTGVDIDASLAKMDAANAASVFSAWKDHSFLWHIDSMGHAVGANHDHTQQRKRRQELPDCYRESGAIYAVRIKDFLSSRSRFCPPVAVVEVTHPKIEIDDISDLEFATLAEEWANRQNAAPLAGITDIRALIMDFDGVHTDNKAHVDIDGRETVAVSRADGMGLDLLRKGTPVACLIVSKERYPVAAKRAEKLKVPIILQCDDKVVAVREWLEGRGLTYADAAFVGNDLNDLEVMKSCRFAFSPADAIDAVKQVSHYVTRNKGGEGAIREICDMILGAHANSGRP